MLQAFILFLGVLSVFFAVFSVFFLIRNVWTYKITVDLVDRIYAENTKRIRIDQKMIDYDLMDRYEHILFRKPWCWDPQKFNQDVWRELRTSPTTVGGGK